MAQNKKISQLTSLTEASSNDLFPIVDVEVPETKKITVQDLFASPQPIGIINPVSAIFTTLELGGTIVSDFSTDGTLGGDSDTVIPTEKAIKTYVDNAISVLSPNKIGQGDSSVEVLDSTSPAIVNIIIDSSLVSTINSSGLRLASGSRINEFSNDITLSGSSATAVPTEHAVKAYVDSKIAGTFFDSTDAGSIVFIDSTGGLEVNVNEIKWLNQSFRINSTFTNLDSFDDAYGLRTAVDIKNSSIYTGNAYGNYVSVELPSDSTNGVGNIYGILVENIRNSINPCDSQVGLKVNVKTFEGTQTSVYGQQLYLDTSATAIIDVVGLDISLNGPGAVNGDATALRITGKDPGTVSGNSYSILVEGASSKVKFNGSMEMASSIVSINEFSNDIYLTDDSPNALVTEHAVKTYVDAQVGSPNKILQGNVKVETIDNTSVSGVFINAPNQVLSDSTTTVQISFRFDGYLTSDWADPSKMVDGSLITASNAGFGPGTYSQYNDTNTADTTSHIGTITKVELRINSKIGVGNVVSFDLTPVFSGNVYGTPINLLSVNGWSSYFDITNDVGAPSTWTWEDVNKLDTRVRAIIGSPGGGAQDYAQARQVEIRVTHLNQHYVEGTALVGKFDKFGLKLELGTSIKEFSTDESLGGNSDTAVPTEKAIKTYVDNQIDYIINHLDLMNVKMIYSDSTGISGEIILADGTADLSVLLIPKEDGKYVVKNISQKRVTILPFTGTIDGQSTLVLDSIFRSATLASNGANFYII